MRIIGLSRFLMLAMLLGCMSKVQPSESTDSFPIYEYTQEYVIASWNENDATIITLYGSTADIRGSGAVFAGRTLTIREAGTYLLSGMLENGQVIIDAGKNDVVRLVLNGVSLHNETGPAIYAPKSKEVVLIIETGTQNTVSDGSGRAGSDEQNSAIYVQDDLSITGSGILAVTGNYRHGIRVQDTLIVTGGVISVNSVGDAIRGRDGVIINGGFFTLEAGGDGIQSNNDSEAMGFIIITGGVFNIKAHNDGIQAESVLTITDGIFQIVSGGGSANAPIRVESRGWGRQAPMPQTAEDSVSMKGIKAVGFINIMGGNITIDARDDGVHSDGDIAISSGKLSVRTGDDGIHANGAVTISGGEINIPVCYEGIEGLSVTISGGNIALISRDDAINAADGSSPVGRMGWGRAPLNNNVFVRISGGTVDLYASRDGIDANGNVFIDGGTIKISGPSQMMEGAIDFDGNLLVTGGELITAGSVLSASQNSTQPVLFVSYARQQPSGSAIAIKDSRGNTLLEYTSKTAYSYSGFTSPSFRTGETYSLFINNEKRVDIRLTGILTSIGDSGGAYSGGRGAPRRL
jgi:phage baseplate assembly protein gpV